MKVIRIYILLLMFFSINMVAGQSLPNIVCVSQIGTNDTLTFSFKGPPCIPYLVWGYNGVSVSSVDTVFSPTVKGITRTRGAMQSYFLTCLPPGADTSDTVNNLPPVTPEIEYVSVLGGDSVLISWLESTSSKTFGYLIYWNNPGVTIIDTVYGKGILSYIHDSSKAYNKSCTYYIAAIDSCDNKGTISLKQHRTIYAKVTGIDSCTETVSLTWTSYINFVGGVKEYQVHVSGDGGPFTLVSPPGYDTLNYSYLNVNNYDTICFRIDAIDSAGLLTASSNVICAGVEVLIQPTYTYLTNVSVMSTNQQINIEWYGDTAADIKEYSIYRKESIGGFVKLSPKPYAANPLSFSDVSSMAPESFNYYYKIITVDICDGEQESNIVQTVLLQGSAEELVNILQWNALDMGTLPVSIDDYEIYRRVDNVWSAGPIATIPATSPLTYSDSIATIISESGKYYYIVAANYVESSTLKSYQSYSNLITLEQPFKLFIPTAFIPNGKILINRTFQPVMTFIDISTYSLQIFNKWGELVFETQDMDEGWDGSVNGKIQPANVYVYNIQITESDGYTFFKRGTVMLIR